MFLVIAAATPALRGQKPPAAHYAVHAMGCKTVDGAIPLDVELRVDSPPGQRIVFEFPIWTPGSYRVREFPDRIAEVTAAAADRAVPAERLHRGVWQVVHGGAPSVTLRYRVMMAPNDRFMDPSSDRRCITYEGPAVYAYARGLQQLPCHVTFALPAGWSQASGLEPRPDGSFFAPDYDVLADCPVKIGQFQRFAFTSHGKPVEAVLDAGTDLEFDHEAWTRGLQAIVDEGGAIFGGLPFDRYVFLYTAGRNAGGGGLEHLNSTAIGVSRGGLQRSPASSFGVTAHEFFHCWNVKRLRPIELGPFQYDRPNRTTGLWLAEGVTSYYGNVLQARAGQRNAKDFWRSMAGTIAGWENTAGRPHTSPEQASLRVWDTQPPDRVVDYYGAGTVLGLLLDLQIRAATDNGRSLDDAMAAMFAFCQQNRRGLTSEEIEAHCSRAAGIDLGAFFDAHVRGTVVPAYERIFAAAGLRFSATRQTSKVLRGFHADRDEHPVFVDCAALERTGGAGQPQLVTGIVREIDQQAVASSKDVTTLVAAAAARNSTSLKIDYETANGSRRTVVAPIEERTKWAVTIEPQEDAAEARKAIAAGILASRRR